MIPWERMKLSSSKLVCRYITLGASMELYMVDLDPLFKVTEVVDRFSILGGFRMISLARMKLGSSNLVCRYITFGALMGLQMVDLDPLFKVTGSVDLFSILGGFRTIS